jgi:hypothetical protein
MGLAEGEPENVSGMNGNTQEASDIGAYVRHAHTLIGVNTLLHSN